TYHFQPAALQSALTAAGISTAPPKAAASATAPASADNGTKPIVVLPVLQVGGKATLWDDPNPWRDAWQNRPAGGNPTHLLVPLGDVGDVAVIDADKA